MAQQAAMAAVEAEAKHETVVETSSTASINMSAYLHRLVSFLARNFYTLKYVALTLAFFINLMLLTYKVTSLIEEGDEDGSMENDLFAEASAEGSAALFGSGSGFSGSGDFSHENGDDEEDEEPLEYAEIPEKYYLVAYTMRLLAALHSIVSLAMLVAYYHLKVILEELRSV